MTRLASFGFEEGNLSICFASVGTPPAGLVSGSASARTGDWCLNLAGSSDIVRTYPISTGTAMFIGMGQYYYGAVTLGAVRPLVILYDLTSAILVQLRLTTDRKLLATVGTTNVATGTSVLPINGWEYLEMYVSIDNSTGTFAVKVDGVQEINFTGDTQTGANSVISTVEFTCAGGDQDHYLDDVVINSPAGSSNNTWPGTVKLYPVFPNGAGDVTQLIQGGVTGSSNYGQVNEVPYSNLQYVYESIQNKYDLYNLQDPSLPADAQIQNVIVSNAAAVDSGAGSLTGVVKSGGVEAQGQDHTLSETYKIIQDVFPVDPSTNEGWTIAAMAALQIGPKVR